jgi:hypothetical protein
MTDNLIADLVQDIIDDANNYKSKSEQATKDLNEVLQEKNQLVADGIDIRMELGIKSEASIDDVLEKITDVYQKVADYEEELEELRNTKRKVTGFVLGDGVEAYLDGEEVHIRVYSPEAIEQVDEAQPMAEALPIVDVLSLEGEVLPIGEILLDDEPIIDKDKEDWDLFPDGKEEPYTGIVPKTSQEDVPLVNPVVGDLTSKDDTAVKTSDLEILPPTDDLKQQEVVIPPIALGVGFPKDKVELPPNPGMHLLPAKEVGVDLEAKVTSKVATDPTNPTDPGSVSEPFNKSQYGLGPNYMGAVVVVGVIAAIGAGVAALVYYNSFVTPTIKGQTEQPTERRFEVKKPNVKTPKKGSYNHKPKVNILDNKSYNHQPNEESNNQYGSGNTIIDKEGTIIFNTNRTSPVFEKCESISRYPEDNDYDRRPLQKSDMIDTTYTACGSLITIKGFTKPDNWENYICRVPEKGETLCKGRDSYSNRRLVKKNDLIFGCYENNQKCCPPKQEKAK